MGCALLVDLRIALPHPILKVLGEEVLAERLYSDSIRLVVETLSAVIDAKGGPNEVLDSLNAEGGLRAVYRRE
jgi:hypothetical protein